MNQLLDYFENASWDKDETGHHVVRNNHIYECGQSGIVGCSGAAFSLIEGNEIHDICIDEKWKNAEKRTLVKTSTLEKAQIPNQAFTNPDGSPLKIDYDYLGTKRKGSNPYPGPFEAKRSGKIEWKVWQKK